MGWISREDLDRWFGGRAPTFGDLESFRAIREAARELARAILERSPRCGDQSAAIRKVREAVWAAESAIVSDRGRPDGDAPTP